MRKLFSFLLVLILFVSCNSTISDNDAKNKLQAFLQVSISDSIKITDYKTSAAIGGDYTEVFIVHLKKDEFDKIFNKVGPERDMHISYDTYGYSIQKDREMTSAIFDPKKCTIKYTYNYE